MSSFIYLYVGYLIDIGSNNGLKILWRKGMNGKKKEKCFGEGRKCHDG